MILIRKCITADEKYIADICYITGYMGEDLTLLNIFNDKVLFSYLFCLYYIRYEAENCYAAVDTDLKRPIGYIIGTADTKIQRKRFITHMSWRIVHRIMTVTIWRHPEAIKFLLHQIKSLQTEFNGIKISDEYPAHLHINILPAYQSMGIGERLLSAFESNIKGKAHGIHLSTTSKNTKAVQFYQKMGYKAALKSPSRIWQNELDAVSIIFVKKL